MILLLILLLFKYFSLHINNLINNLLEKYQVKNP